MEGEILKYALEARKLVKLSEKAVRGFVDGNVNLLLEYYEAKKDFIKQFAEQPTLDIPNKGEREDIEKVLRDKTPLDKAVRFITNEQLNIKFDVDELSELAMDIFYPWFSGADYVDAMIKADRIFLSGYYDEEVEKMFAEARRCYAFQQYRASIMMCRLVLEKFAVIVLDQIGEAAKNKYGQVIFSRCFDKLDENLNRENGVLRKLYYTLCEIAHGNNSVDCHQAEKYLKDTVKAVELVTKLRKADSNK